jgi:hypothetical protein
MKIRILSLIVILAIAVVSCQKDEKETVPQDVSFGIDQVDQTGLKNDTILCPTDEQGNLLLPTVAEIEVKDLGGNLIGIFYPELFVLNDKLYTQAIKLVPGSYKITKFVLWTKNPVNFPPPDAKIVMATPNSGAAFAEYISPLYLLDYEFTVDAFAKKEIKIEVLCFEPAKYTEFGFFWFQVQEIVVREVCFFGDICILNPEAYAGSIYAQGGIMVDEEAAIRVIVKRNGVEVPNSPFDNLQIYGTGQVLCVQYPDYLRLQDTFTFELQVWVPSATPGIFVWQTYATYTTDDETPLTQLGTNGVVDFAIGDCSPWSTNVYSWLAPIAP